MFSTFIDTRDLDDVAAEQSTHIYNTLNPVLLYVRYVLLELRSEENSMGVLLGNREIF